MHFCSNVERKAGLGPLTGVLVSRCKCMYGNGVAIGSAGRIPGGPSAPGAALAVYSTNTRARQILTSSCSTLMPAVREQECTGRPCVHWWGRNNGVAVGCLWWDSLGNFVQHQVLVPVHPWILTLNRGDFAFIPLQHIHKLYTKTTNLYCISGPIQIEVR